MTRCSRIPHQDQGDRELCQKIAMVYRSTGGVPYLITIGFYPARQSEHENFGETS
jgi:hypothetical protein